jgi:hypothetical protein
MRISFSRRANPVPDLRGVACGFTWPRPQLVVRSNYFCDGWIMAAGDQEQAKPELSRAHTVGSALGGESTILSPFQNICHV